uniref:DOCKER domain-containing protein n=1 Tax=Romanomermis culicivorax TaxID=13658 RepID=A0A915HIL7_ROMCU
MGAYNNHLPIYYIDEVNVFPFAQSEFPYLEALVVDCNDNDEDFLISNVNEYVLCATKAERYESVNDIYKLIIPILEKRSDFESLANVYNALNTMCLRLASFSKSGRRLSDTYFRVILFNQTFFESQHAQEYIYREEKAVTLSEMTEKLRKCYTNKFGAVNVGLLSSSSE